MKKLLLGLLIVVPVWASTADYTSLPDGCSASVVLGGATVTGSAQVCAGAFAGIRGIGIQGGGSDVTLDLGETMTIDFGSVVSDVQIQIWDVTPPGNVTFGFTAFNGATNLGSFGIPALSVDPTTFNLTSIAGVDFSKFTLSISSSTPVGLQIQDVSFAPAAVPEPGTLMLFGLGAAGLFLSRRRKA
jgi:hypothetical protein